MQTKIYLIHFSSDYVLRERNQIENDDTNPLNYYGKQKE